MSTLVKIFGSKVSSISTAVVFSLSVVSVILLTYVFAEEEATTGVEALKVVLRTWTCFCPDLLGSPIYTANPSKMMAIKDKTPIKIRVLLGIKGWFV